MESDRTTLVLLVLALAAAIYSLVAPGGTMPINYWAILWRSIPAAAVWFVTSLILLHRIGRRALWLLMLSPLALYWIVHLVIDGLPDCYYTSNCV